VTHPNEGPGRTVEISQEAARRLVVSQQHLSGARRRRGRDEELLSVVRDVCYVQWDPVSIVAPSHVLAFWSRIDGFRPRDLDRVMWTERRLFHYYAHAAAIVLTEDFPLYASLMRRYPESLSSSWGAWRAQARKWVPAHAALRTQIVSELESGPRRADQFTAHVKKRRDPGTWGSYSDVTTMLFHLQMSGEVILAGLDGGQNLWGLSQDLLPSWVDRTELSDEEVERRGAERAIRAMGLASLREVNFYFLRGQYHHLRETIAKLWAEGRIHRVRVAGLDGNDERYVHAEDFERLDEIAGRAWTPRLSLLSPFDNLTCTRDRIRSLFGFDHFVEMYVTPAKRRYGYYVLPVLWGDRFVGRIDPRLDREHGRLEVKAVHAEPGVPRDPEIPEALGSGIHQLADFLGAKEVTYSRRVPASWRRALR
jgi:uncharacterized protein